MQTGIRLVSMPARETCDTHHLVYNASWLKVGVALLGGFGDLNVDRAGAGDAATSGKTQSKSTALMVQRADLMKLRVPELKRKLKEVGVDLTKHAGPLEKKVSSTSRIGQVSHRWTSLSKVSRTAFFG